MEMPNAVLVVLLGLVCGFAGALGRHVQGGAGPRWLAMMLYIVCVAPVFYIYCLKGSWPLGTGIGLLLIVAFYVNQTAAQNFGSLLGGLARYGWAFGGLAVLTLNPWALIGILPTFVALKWARQHHDSVKDPHMWFELVQGFCIGAAYGVAPI